MRSGDEDRDQVKQLPYREVVSTEYYHPAAIDIHDAEGTVIGTITGVRQCPLTGSNSYVVKFIAPIQYMQGSVSMDWNLFETKEGTGND